MVLTGHMTFCSYLSTFCCSAVYNSAAAGLDSSSIRVSEKNKEGHAVPAKPKISNNWFLRENAVALTHLDLCKELHIKFVKTETKHKHPPLQVKTYQK